MLLLLFILLESAWTGSAYGMEHLLWFQSSSKPDTAVTITIKYTEWSFIPAAVHSLSGM